MEDTTQMLRSEILSSRTGMMIFVIFDFPSIQRIFNILLPALAGKTHRDHFEGCCCLLSSVFSVVVKTF